MNIDIYLLFTLIASLLKLMLEEIAFANTLISRNISKSKKTAHLKTILLLSIQIFSQMDVQKVVRVCKTIRLAQTLSLCSHYNTCLLSVEDSASLS